MNIQQFIDELTIIGNKYGFDKDVQISGCYGSTTEMFYFDEAEIVDKENFIINIPTDLGSG